MIKLYTDGAFDPRTRKAAAGILIVVDSEQIQLKVPLEATDNHQAEFLAALSGFVALKKLEKDQLDQPIFFYSDSRIVIDSLNKEYAKNYSDELQQLIQAEDQYTVVVNQWLADHENQGAHRLALQALKKS